jgi:hypothetical protein
MLGDRAMRFSRLFSCSAVLLAAIASGCGGSGGVSGQPAANFAGEYTFVVTGSGGTCAEIPRATGNGVEIFTQESDWATSCFVKDACDGEICRAGPVVGNVFTSDVELTPTIGACQLRESRHIVTTRNADGVLDRRNEHRLEYLGGDCSGLVLPCEFWQTSAVTPCSGECYHEYCPPAP